ncbi:MAG: hypothetical protein KDD89_11850, partial [Anaerolineales bacterium]|nr:hypothetical protein [Anaerolineales bacterium]
HIELSLQDDPKRLWFKVQDNGRGFEKQTTSELRRQGHHGLYGIESRLQRHDGDLIMDPQLGRGTTICGYLPLT